MGRGIDKGLSGLSEQLAPQAQLLLMNGEKANMLWSRMDQGWSFIQFYHEWWYDLR